MFSEPHTHSSKMSWWTIPWASPAPCEPTPTCHCCPDGCDFSFTEGKELSWHAFGTSSFHLDGSHLLGTAGNDGRDCSRFCQRPDQLVIIEQQCCRFLFVLAKEHDLRVKQELTLFWDVSCGPLDCQDLKNSDHSSPLSSTSRRHDCILLPLPFTRNPRGTHGRQFDMRERRNHPLATSLLPTAQGASLYLPPSPRCTGFLSSLLCVSGVRTSVVHCFPVRPCSSCPVVDAPHFCPVLWGLPLTAFGIDIDRGIGDR